MNAPFMIPNMFNAKGMGTSVQSGGKVSGKGGVSKGFADMMAKLQGGGRGAGVKAQNASTGLKGHALMAHLKKSLQSAGVSLDQLVADDKALANLEKVLVGAGFDAGQVRNLLGELTANAGGKGVKLSTLFKGIAGLDENPPKEFGPEYLDISALPHLETILTRLGLSSAQAAGVLANAKIEGKGIDTARLSAGLKQLLPNADDMREKMPSMDGQQQTIAMMQRIGLLKEGGQTGDVDLKDLIMALDKFGTRNAPATAGNGNADAALVSHLQSTSESGDTTQNGLAGAWQGFLRHLQQNTGDPKAGNQADGKAFLRKFSKGDIDGQGLLKNKAGAVAPGENIENEMSKVAGKTPGSAAALATMAGESGNQLEKSLAATAAATGDRGMRPPAGATETTAKADDTATLFAEGLSRRLGTTEQTPDAAPRPAARALPAYMLDQVSRRILQSRLRGESEIQLQLKPASLGRLKMSIENTTNGLKVSIIAESQAARDMLMSHSGDLKTTLSAQGVQLDKIDVEAQADFSQTMADSRQGSHRSGGRRRFAGGNRPASVTETSEPAMGPAPAPESTDGGLNLVA